MEILVSKDFQLYWTYGSFPKGTIVCVNGFPQLRPAITEFSTGRIDMETFHPQSWSLGNDQFLYIVNGEIFGFNKSDEMMIDLFESNLPKELQDFVCRHRPDLINQIRDLDPELKAKYEHEVGLSKVDV